jgi:mono/diheme cytochrome c family protein
VLQQHSDAYLYYRVSTGKPGTAMPSFHGVLGETERWQVVSYLRSLATAPRP